MYLSDFPLGDATGNPGYPSRQFQNWHFILLSGCGFFLDFAKWLRALTPFFSGQSVLAWLLRLLQKA